jgi:DNA invertase Pin-like site-specific DNA recombinase
MSKTAVIYVRQSRNKAGEHTVSPETQEEACRALPAVASCSKVEVYRDLDVSGGAKGRKQYDAMLDRIRSDGVSVVAAYDQSRAFRSSEFAIHFKALLTEPTHADIQVVFVHGSFDRTPVGGFSYTVLAAAHQMEKEMAGAKIRELIGT